MDAYRQNIAVKVTFLNVAEMAQKAKKRKQCEQSADEIKSPPRQHHHSDDEIGAAIALLMLRYEQPTDECPIPSSPLCTSSLTTSPLHITPTDQPVINARTAKVASAAARLMDIEPRTKKSRNNLMFNNELQMQYINIIHEREKSQQQQRNSIEIESTSSLLTTCRNILREFLSQESTK